MSRIDTFRSSQKNPISLDPYVGLSEKEQIKFQKKLIKLISEAETLYREDHSDYNNIAINRLEWVMIAEKCKKTVSDCKNVWHSLLRTYFSLPPVNDWVIGSSFKAMEPYLTQHEMQTPTEEQKKILLRDLKTYIVDGGTSMNNIWLKIAAKCNSIAPGAIMSSYNWQKFWMNLKQGLGTDLSTPGLDMNSRYNPMCDEELSIIELCGVNQSDTISNIITALKNNNDPIVMKKTEPTKPTNQPPTCIKCRSQSNKISPFGYCENCSELTKLCDICYMGPCKLKYNISNWSKKALDLLPTPLVDQVEILICCKCSDKLKKQATKLWRICRFCHVKGPKTSLDDLYSEKFIHLRKCIKDYLYFEFKEHDGLPGLICEKCHIHLKNIIESIQIFHQNQDNLTTIHFHNFIGIPNNNDPLRRVYKNNKKPTKKTTTPLFNSTATPPTPTLNAAAAGGEWQINEVFTLCQPNSIKIEVEEQETTDIFVSENQVPESVFTQTAETLVREKRKSQVGPQKSGCSKPGVFIIDEPPEPIKRPPDELIIDEEPTFGTTEATSKLKIIEMDGVPVAMKRHPYFKGIYIPLHSKVDKYEINLQMRSPSVLEARRYWENVDQFQVPKLQSPDRRPRLTEESPTPKIKTEMESEDSTQVDYFDPMTCLTVNDDHDEPPRIKLREIRVLVKREKF